MKTVITLALVCFATAMLRGSDASDYTSESTAVSEIFTSKVQKVYSFEEGNHEYVAYVVKWKDHDVVVSPSGFLGVSEKYKVGDTIRCEMRQSHVRLGGGTKSQIMFSVFSGPTAHGDPKRLEAVAAEVQKRRALRETQGTTSEQPKSP